MLKDGFEAPALSRLHGVAKSPDDHNLHTALVTLLERGCHLNEFIKDIDAGSVTVVIKAQATLHRLHEQAPLHFKRVFGADTLVLRDFWTKLLSSPEGRARNKNIT